MYTIARSFCSLLCIFGAVIGGYAQAITSAAQEHYRTEEELSIQYTMIEASREKLIGNVDKSLQLYQSLVDKKRNLPNVWYEIARLLHAKQQDQDALDAIDKAISIDPNNEWYHLFKIDLFERQNNFLDAAASLQNYLRKYQGAHELMWRLAYLYVEGHQHQKAIDIYNQIENISGVQKKTTQKKYNLYTRSDDHTNAINELEKYLEVYPKDIEILHLLAANYQKIGKTAKHNKIIDKILSLDPHDARANLAHIQTKNPKQNNSTKIQKLKALILDPNGDIDTKVKALIPPLQSLLEHYDEQLSKELTQLSTLLIKSHPQSAKAHAIAADVYYYSGQYGRALEAYKKTLELNKQVYTVWEQYLYTLAKLHHWNTLQNQVQNALDYFPNKARLYYFEALSAYKLQQNAQVDPALQQARIIGRKNRQLLRDIEVLQVAKRLNTSYDEEMDKIVSKLDKYQTNLLVRFIYRSTNPKNMTAISIPKLNEYSRALLAYSKNAYQDAADFLNAYFNKISFIEPQFMDLAIAINKQHPSAFQNVVADFSTQLKQMKYQSIFEKK